MVGQRVAVQCSACSGVVGAKSGAETVYTWGAGIGGVLTAKASASVAETVGWSA